MFGRVQNWFSHARTLLGIAERSVPPWLRYGGFVCLGSAMTVVFGWVDVQGDGLRIYLALVGVALASAAAFVSAKTINEVADRRATRRSANAAIFRIEFLIAELNRFPLKFNNETPRGVDGMPDAAQAERLEVFLGRIATAANSEPDFDTLIDSPADRQVAHDVVSWFKYYVFHTSFPTEDGSPRRLLAMARFMSSWRIGVMESAVEDLEEAAAHFLKKIEGF